MNFSEEASYVKSLYGKADGAPTVPEVPWTLAFTYDETPFLKISCSYCHQSQETISDDPAVGAFRHCNMVEEPPKELIEKLVKYQIKRGVRRAPSIFQRITGQTPSLNAF